MKIFILNTNFVNVIILLLELIIIHHSFEDVFLVD